jgi:hypothetical protein
MIMRLVYEAMSTEATAQRDAELGSERAVLEQALLATILTFLPRIGVSRSLPIVVVLTLGVSGGLASGGVISEGAALEGALLATIVTFLARIGVSRSLLIVVVLTLGVSGGLVRGGLVSGGVILERGVLEGAAVILDFLRQIEGRTSPILVVWVVLL